MRYLGEIIAALKQKQKKKEALVPFTTLNNDDAISGVCTGRFQIVDVRTPKEYDSHHIPDSMPIPIQELEKRYAELDPSREILVVCERGVRSQKACSFLNKMGFKRLYNLNGGLSAYKGLKVGKGFRLKIKSYFSKLLHF